MQTELKQKFKVGQWIIDPVYNTISSPEQTKKVERRLIKVLLALGQAPDQTLSKEALLETVWTGKIVSDETLSVAISGIRKSLGCNAKSPIFVSTITGYGFQLIPKMTVYSPIRTTTEQLKKSKKIRFASLLVVLLSLVFYIGLHGFKKNHNDVPKHLITNEDYARGIYLIQQPDFQRITEGKQLLERLLIKMPNEAHVINAFGKAQLFQANWISEPTAQIKKLQEAKQTFLKGLAIAPNFADLLLQLGLIATYESDAQNAKKYLLKSIKIAPKDPITHKLYASIAIALGDKKAALHHIQIHRNLSPKEYSAENIAWIYNMTGEYDKALTEIQKLKELRPNSKSYHTASLKLYENMGKEAAGYSKPELQAAESAFKTGGLKKLNYWLANIKKEKMNIGQYLPPISFARYHLAAGELDKALFYIEKALNEKLNLVMWLNVDPKYAALRSNPRFKQIIKQLHLTNN